MTIIPPPKNIVELSVRDKRNQPEVTEILKNVLMNLGVGSQDIVEYNQDGIQEVATFFFSLPKAKQFKMKIDRLGLKNIKTQLTILKRSDWQDKWKRDFVPFHLTERLDIVPVWRKSQYRPGKNREPILLDTITAFGTGLHDTTRFMAQLIEDCRGRFERFLDIGTGTGILSLVAFKCQAKYICAIDVDKECIGVARSNAGLNKSLMNRLETIDLMDFKFEEPFDYVAANLITHDLIRLKRKIFSLVRPDKFLAVSGISLENAPRLKREFKKLSLRCLRIYKSPHWAAFLYKKIL